ncbi:hypothetical protein GCM10019016_007310 [Streptomyces prasinosporus]|uniref:NAD-glutamate dehydrogenase N-terminal ACT1 domain-containing protein n=1 Tax=Streptomyces prasinosporus TaxID=68256 RepID=A0ABP6TGP1_9ACTN
MQTKLDEAKAELLDRAARVAENSPAGGKLPTGTTDESAPDQDSVLAFLQRYYLHTAPEDLTDRDPVDVFGAAVSHYRLAENRPQGTANVRVHTPTVEENGWTCSHSVVEVVTDDMPFLVDSVTNELTRQGRGIHVVIHPQFVVRRDVTGKLIEVLPTPAGGDLPHDAPDLPHDAHVESWIHVEIDRETDRGDLKQITADLLRDPVRRPRGRRGLGQDAPGGDPAGRGPGRRARPRRPAPGSRSRRPASCCAGWPTTTSPSSATASTSCAGTTRSPPSPAPASASCAPTRSTPPTRATRSARPSSGCPPTPAPRRASTSCWC